MKKINIDAKVIVRHCLYVEGSDGVPESITRKRARMLENYLTDRQLSYLASAVNAGSLFYEELRRFEHLKVIRDLMTEWKKNNPNVQ